MKKVLVQQLVEVDFLSTFLPLNQICMRSSCQEYLRSMMLLLSITTVSVWLSFLSCRRKNDKLAVAFLNLHTVRTIDLSVSAFDKQ